MSRQAKVQNRDSREPKFEHGKRSHAAAPPAPTGPARILALQRTAGNQAVEQLLGAGSKGIQAKLKLGAPNSKFEQEADRTAEQILQGSGPVQSPKGSLKGSPKNLQKASPKAWLSPSKQASRATAPPDIDLLLRSPGAPLDGQARSFMEPRFGQNFGQVRVHTGARAARSAEAINARAFTVGRTIVFNSGQYAPNTSAGRKLLAHELTHVVQQSHAAGANGDIVQRAGFFETIARFFGGGTFSEEELQDYLSFLRTERRIEDNFDSDNKAREVVARWQRGDAAFQTLTVPIRILLIQEMASGYLSGADQQGILALIQEAIASEQTTILAAVNISRLRARFDGERRQQLTRLIDDNELERATASLGGNWTVEGVQEILHRHGDEETIRTILAQHIQIIRFETAFDTWRHDDGTIEEVELTGLRGNRRGNEIRIRASLSNEDAASTIFHEVSHFTSTVSDYLEQEIDVRVLTEEFRIRHGLPETNPGYRNPDGTVNRETIRREIMGSSHYNPVGRRRIGRRYEGEEVTRGWRLP